MTATDPKVLDCLDQDIEYARANRLPVKFSYDAATGLIAAARRLAECERKLAAVEETLQLPFEAGPKLMRVKIDKCLKLLDQ